MKTIKSISLILTLVMVPLLSYAQDRVGNGGDVLVCPGQKMILLDTYELTTTGQELGFDATTQDPFLKVERKITELSKISKLRGARYLEWLSSFPREAQFRAGIELPDIDDTGLVVIPRGCKLEQIAVQAKSEDVPVLGYRYIINKDLWDQLDPDNQAVLLMHELVYREQLTANPKVLSSLRVRMMTRALVSKDFHLETYFHVQSNSSVMFFENEWFWGEIVNLYPHGNRQTVGLINRDQVRIWKGFGLGQLEVLSVGDAPECWILHRSLRSPPDRGSEELVLRRELSGKVRQVYRESLSQDLPKQNSVMICPDKQIVSTNGLTITAFPDFELLDFGPGKAATVSIQNKNFQARTREHLGLFVNGINSNLEFRDSQINLSGNLDIQWHGKTLGRINEIKTESSLFTQYGSIENLSPHLEIQLTASDRNIVSSNPLCNSIRYISTSVSVYATLSCNSLGVSFTRTLDREKPRKIEIRFQSAVSLQLSKEQRVDSICGSVADNTIIDYKKNGRKVEPVLASGTVCYNFENSTADQSQYP